MDGIEYCSTLDKNFFMKAPEALKHRIYSNKTDVWSYGVTLIEILIRDDPFPGMDPVS